MRVCLLLFCCCWRAERLEGWCSIRMVRTRPPILSVAQLLFVAQCFGVSGPLLLFFFFSCFVSLSIIFFVCLCVGPPPAPARSPLHVNASCSGCVCWKPGESLAFYLLCFRFMLAPTSQPARPVPSARERLGGAYVGNSCEISQSPISEYLYFVSRAVPHTAAAVLTRTIVARLYHGRLLVAAS